MDKKLTFILPKLYQPRYLKRIREAKNKGYEVTVLYFNRFNQIDREVEELKGIHKLKISDINNSFKLSRVTAYLKLFHYLLLNKKNYLNQTLYLFTFDLFVLVSLIFNVKNIIYEIGDIIYLEYKPVFRKIFSSIEMHLMDKTSKVILTSDGFRSYYRSRGYEKKNLLVIPNKVPIEIINKASISRKNTNADQLTIGYVGIFRYKPHLFRFIDKVNNHSKIKMNFYGYSNFLSELKHYIKDIPNINYHGKYKTEELQDIYQKIDVSYCVYKKGMNEKIAEPNKYYESLFFKTPIVCQQDTLVAKKVKKLNTGFVLDVSSETEISRFIDGLDYQHLEEKISSINKLPKEYSYLTGEVFND